MAAVMASDSQILALSTMFTEDVFAFYGGAARFGPAVQVQTGRIFVILLTVVAYAIAMTAPQSIFDIASQYAFAGYAALSPLLVAALFWKKQHEVGRAGGRGVDGRRGGGDRGAAVDGPGAAAGRACNGLGRGRRRRHHPHRGGDDGAWISPGGADDDHLGAPDVHRVARDGGLAARARHAREVRGIDMDRKTWLICVIAAIGFAFDTYELLMLPLIARPALMDLLKVPATDPLINQWVGYLFYWPAVFGGIFGLLGGYLTDRLGPPAGADLEHPALRVLRVRGRLLDVGLPAALLAHLHVRRRLRRVRRGGRVAGGALHRSEAPRGGHRLHAGVRIARRPDGDGGVSLRGHQRRELSRGARRPRGVALHADVGHSSPRSR